MNPLFWLGIAIILLSTGIILLGIDEIVLHNKIKKLQKQIDELKKEK